MARFKVSFTITERPIGGSSAEPRRANDKILRRGQREAHRWRSRLVGSAYRPLIPRYLVLKSLADLPMNVRRSVRVVRVK